MKNLWLLIALAILAIGIGAVVTRSRQQPAPTAPETEPVQTGQEEQVTSANQVSIESGSFFFRPNRPEAKSGQIQVKVDSNSGFHTFVIDKLGVKETLTTGKTFSFAAEPGTYEYYCDVPGHREKGMVGSLTIR